MSDPEIIDLHWLGGDRRIGSWRVGELLIDCGPTTTLDTLVAAMGDWRPRALLLTHIHFDHAGAAGELVRRWPDLEVVVHRRGARHLADPERLESSARRVFGDDFDRRFGSLVPIPEENLTVLDGGETVHGLSALYTPGHAVHHLAYIDDGDGRAWVGDIAGVRLRPGDRVLPPTPPPDIDIDAWLASIELVRERAPRWLGLPHFGEVTDAAAMLEQAAEEVRAHADAGARLDADGYIAWARERLGVPAGEADAVVPLAQNAAGLQRWAGLRDAA
jgi:glyoxylase-like metal-dependent hydrolase (beta-lactamase superfamily II)